MTKHAVYETKDGGLFVMRSDWAADINENLGYEKYVKVEDAEFANPALVVTESGLEFARFTDNSLVDITGIE